MNLLEYETPEEYENIRRRIREHVEKIKIHNQRDTRRRRRELNSFHGLHGKRSSFLLLFNLVQSTNNAMNGN